MTNLEIKTIEHKGIKVRYRIDYDNGTADLLDATNNIKMWNFSGRSLEYMIGWLNIIDAMRVAVEQCKKSLEQDHKEKEISINKRIDIFTKLVRNKKKK